MDWLEGNWAWVAVCGLLYLRVRSLERTVRAHVALVVPHLSRTERAVAGLVFAHDGASAHAMFLEERRGHRMEAGHCT